MADCVAYEECMHAEISQDHDAFLNGSYQKSVDS